MFTDIPLVTMYAWDLRTMVRVEFTVEKEYNKWSMKKATRSTRRVDNRFNEGIEGAS